MYDPLFTRAWLNFLNFFTLYPYLRRLIILFQENYLSCGHVTLHGACTMVGATSIRRWRPCIPYCQRQIPSGGVVTAISQPASPLVDRPRCDSILLSRVTVSRRLPALDWISSLWHSSANNTCLATPISARTSLPVHLCPYIFVIEHLCLTL